MNFVECLQLLEVLIKNNIISIDENNKNNVLVYREAGEKFPEGWYSENIHSVARELVDDIKAQEYLRNVLSEKGIVLEFEDVIGNVNAFMQILNN